MMLVCIIFLLSHVYISQPHVLKHIFVAFTRNNCYYARITMVCGRACLAINMKDFAQIKEILLISEY